MMVWAIVMFASQMQRGNGRKKECCNIEILEKNITYIAIYREKKRKRNCFEDGMSEGGKRKG